MSTLILMRDLQISDLIWFISSAPPQSPYTDHNMKAQSVLVRQTENWIPVGEHSATVDWASS